MTIIGRNESATLGKALRSVSGLDREIILVDTGSIDYTVQIARKHDARIFHFEWRDDFAAARNAALEQVRFSWILALDCDEEFTREDADIDALKAACPTS